jgi:hypothetical protein
MYTAFTAKEWGIFVGGLIMVVVWFARMFLLARLSSDWLPWVSSGMGVLLSISIDLTSKVPWWKAVLNGLLVGAAASGLWSQVGKNLLPSELKKKETIEVLEDKPVSVHDAPTTPKIIVLKDEAFRDSTLDATAVMDEIAVKKLLHEDEITEPARKVVDLDDTKPSS